MSGILWQTLSLRSLCALATSSLQKFVGQLRFICLACWISCRMFPAARWTCIYFVYCFIGFCYSAVVLDKYTVCSFYFGQFICKLNTPWMQRHCTERLPASSWYICTSQGWLWPIQISLTMFLCFLPSPIIPVACSYSLIVHVLHYTHLCFICLPSSFYHYPYWYFAQRGVTDCGLLLSVRIWASG